MNYYIKHIEYYLPPNVLDNDMLSKKWDISSEFIESRVGIIERHIAGPDEPTSELAYKATIKLLENSGIDKDDIDMLVVCTQNPDYKLPMVSTLLHSRLGLKKECACFDINLGCSGFVYGLPIAGNFIRLGEARNALLITAEEYSKIIDYDEKNTAALFGDAASAVLLSACDDDYGVIDYSLCSDGKSSSSLIAYNSGVSRDDNKPRFLSMKGREIFKFSTTVVPQSIGDIVSKAGLRKENIKFYIPHQANKFMLQEIRDKMGVTESQFVIDMEKYGNTVSSTIPIAYKNLLDKGALTKGDYLVFCGFGVGLSWGTVLYKYF
ncbi:MAG TPA: ketoacyl-ACP synthase III [Ignavibacteria bacterium]|nr:ketoacyl-ACP synthase III [Ignavibacteria bacterium]